VNAPERLLIVVTTNAIGKFNVLMPHAKTRSSSVKLLIRVAKSARQL